MTNYVPINNTIFRDIVRCLKSLQYALFKIKIRLLESDQKWLRHESSTKPLLSRCKGDNNSKKLIF